LNFKIGAPNAQQQEVPRTSFAFNLNTFMSNNNNKNETRSKKNEKDIVYSSGSGLYWLDEDCRATTTDQELIKIAACLFPTRVS
jgi:hypothetical protein